MCVRRMVEKCHTITQRISARKAAWNQPCQLPLSPCGLRFKLEPIYAVTKMDTVSFMQEVGNYCASSMSPHTHTHTALDRQVVQSKAAWCRQRCSRPSGCLHLGTSKQSWRRVALRVTRYCFHNLKRHELSTNKNSQRQFLLKQSFPNKRVKSKPRNGTTVIVMYLSLHSALLSSVGMVQLKGQRWVICFQPRGQPHNRRGQVNQLRHDMNHHDEGQCSHQRPCYCPPSPEHSHVLDTQAASLSLPHQLP